MIIERGTCACRCAEWKNKHGQAVTSAMLGEFRNNKQTRDEFLSLVRSRNRS